MPLKWRSISSIVSAASMIGEITSSMWEITVAALANIGIRRQASPGARILRRVTIMLIAKQVKPRQARPVPVIQASGPFEGVKTCSDSGGSATVPVSGTL